VTPNPDLLRIEFLGLTVRHDEVALPREDLAIFFASVSDRYGLSRLEYHSDPGATFSGSDGAEFVLRPSQMASCGVTGLGYREGLERVVGLVGEAVERYGIGEMWVEDITLVAVWDVEDPEAARSLLVEDVLQIDDDRLELLAGGGVVAGVRDRADARRAVEGLHPARPDPRGRHLRRRRAARGRRRGPRLPRGAAPGLHDGPHPPLTGGG
jgi:hypothetical protein